MLLLSMNDEWRKEADKVTIYKIMNETVKRVQTHQTNKQKNNPKMLKKLDNILF